MSQVTPTIYVKSTCPWCIESLAVLDQYKIPYKKIVVTEVPGAFDEVRRLSNQTKVPTMSWGGEVLADFGADELIAFLKKKNVI